MLSGKHLLLWGPPKAVFLCRVWLLLAMLAGAGGVARAAHYPVGASCYDCHAVSAAKMVSGSHLIKKSQATNDLGMLSGTSVKCLFCHRAEAVAQQNRDRMFGVWNQFNGASLSKHRAREQSDFTADGQGDFDCLDCHSNVAGVTGDGAGNANVHGVDAALSTLPVWKTFITSFGAPYTDVQLSTTFCASAQCHAPGLARSYGGRVARPRHSFADVSANGNPVTPGSCVTECHGTHNSYQNESLIILRTIGTASNNPGDDPSTRVTPDKCGSCHRQDDAAGVYQYTAQGHGRTSGTKPPSLACNNCHSSSVSHWFALVTTIGQAVNPLRFVITENTTVQSAIRRDPAHKQAYSICLTCHGQYASKLHGTGAVAGCNDCHEPHGTGQPLGVGTTAGSAIQAKMIRPVIPKTDASGAPLYGFNSTTGTWDTIVFGTTTETYRPDGQGLCDNKECHQGRYSPISTTAIWPLSAFLIGTGHTGGAIATGTNYDCTGCHNHTDPAGGWAASAACDNCHGFPPTTGSHAAHSAAGANIIDCKNCHPNPGTANHNPNAYIADATQFDAVMGGSNPGTIRGNVNIDFSQGIFTSYRVGSYTLPMTTTARNGAYGNCAGVGCHGVTLPAEDRGTNVSPTWGNAGTGACGTCHKSGATDFMTTGSKSHVLHAAAVPNGRAIGCQNCHYTTTQDGATILAGGAHLDGGYDTANSGLPYNGYGVTFSYGAPTCTNLSCHGAYRLTTWGAPPDATNCSNCHGIFSTPGGMAATVSAKHKNSDWRMGTLFRTQHTAGSGVGQECSTCHANRDLAVYTTTPGADNHIDGRIQVNANMGYFGVSGAGGALAGCTGACHSSSITTYQMADSGYIIQTLAGASGCSGCHIVGSQTWPSINTSNPAMYPSRAGEHDQHISAIMNRTGLAGNSTCDFCHPNPGGGGHMSNTAGSLGTTADLYQDGINTGTSYKRIDNSAGSINTTNMYSGATKVCSNVDCHYRTPTPGGGAAPSIGWYNSPANTSTCTTCHGYVTGATFAGAALPNAHMQHVGTGSGQKNYQCTSCHPNWTTGVYTTGHQSNVVNVIVTGTLGVTPFNAAYRVGTVTGAVLTTTTVKFGASGSFGVCTNLYCHVKPGTPPWNQSITTAGAGSCTQCHLTLQTTGNNPSSGLHFGGTAPVVSQRMHDDTLNSAQKCGVCHTTIGAQATHVDGTFDEANVGRMGIATFYTQSANDVGSCSGGAGVAGCHDGIGDQGAWARRWDASIHYKPVTPSDYTACEGCHGGFLGTTNSWTFGNGAISTSDGQVSHAYDWDGVNGPKVIGNHTGATNDTRCVACHGYPFGIYTSWAWAFGSTSLGEHGDNQIQMNATMGYTRVGTTTGPVPAYGCASPCHTGSGNIGKGLELSGWPLAMTTGPAGGCTGCHGSAGTGQFWPEIDTTNPALYPNRAGEHAQHIAAIANRTGLAVNGSAATCDFCHPDPGGSNHFNNTAGSLSTTADVYYDGFNTGTTFKRIDGSANGVIGTYAPATETCSNVACHYRTVTPAGWFNGATYTSNCTTCHGYNAGTTFYGAVLPAAHMQHVGTGSGQKAYRCTYCHPDWTTGVYTTGHQSNLVNVTVIGTLGASPFSATYRLGSTGGPAVGTTTVKYGAAGNYGSCANLYCHVQAGSPLWSGSITTAGAGSCTQCHYTGVQTGTNPSSGLHFGTTPPVVSQRMHDDTIDATKKCGVCHTTISAQATHVNGSFDAGNGQTTQMGLASFYVQTANNAGVCFGGGVGTTGCHDGAGDQGKWRRRWDQAIHYTPVTTTNHDACGGCHGGFNTITTGTDWLFGFGLHTTGDGQVEHEYNWDIDTFAGEVVGNHGGSTPQTRCNVCHVYPDAPYGWLTTFKVGNHGNDRIEMNGSMGYQGAAGTPAFGCTGSCHDDNTNHTMEASTWQLVTIAGPAISGCGCHSSGFTTHISTTRGGGGYCTDCHPGGSKGAQHDTAGSASVVLIPFNTTVGVTYTKNAAQPGIHLGGNATIGTTEAEICWNCHKNSAGAKPSEWGIHTGTNSSYNYGSVTDSNWFIATWTSAGFAYKTGKLNDKPHLTAPVVGGGSVHTANMTVGTNWAGSKNASQVRCSYCHDVHNRNKAPNDTNSGGSYLRGSWVGNRYREDGAPRREMLGTTGIPNYAQFGRVPRPRTIATMYGGYQIDQNNGNPNAAIGTLGNFAGLCALCHASGQAWTGANVSAINQFGTPATDWGVGNSNGHSNTVLGGDGSAAIDIYSEVNGRRHPLGTPYTTFNTVTSQSGSRTDSGAPLMSYLHMKSPGYGYGLRQTYFASASAAPQQPAIGASRPYAYQQYQWGAIPIATTQRGYHRFTCSKCHNPHASRLPRLMITNCLDTKVNNWDDQFPSIGTTRRSAENQRVQISQFTSAQNCHRRRDPQFNKTWTGAPTNDGWNNLTPW